MIQYLSPGLVILFIALKLTHQIDWSWVWILAPLWAGVVFWLLLVFVYAVLCEVKK